MLLEVPVIESHPSTLDVILNNPITLPCSATGSPRPTISWQKEGISISTAGNDTNPGVCVCVCVSNIITLFLRLRWKFDFAA